ncbi:HET-domain-containing protein [Nemania sp. FL0031]|nr:HET-domain-containing protein [Nemania sp. FL0031]
MARCDLCHDLQVDSTTNMTTEDTSRPESYRLRTFSISESLHNWRQSARRGCAICSLIWRVLCRFDKHSILDKLSQPSSPPLSAESDDDVYLELTGFVGHTLLLQFVDLPTDMYFPTLELFSSDGNLPTRVLDVGESLGKGSIRLLETEPGQSGKYAALSYCWGKTGNITTTKDTLKERKKGISWSILPKSFRDAVELVRGLGVWYLWIDALCIIQDDVDDWENESAKMADVYQNAFLTISTDAAQDPTQGIFTARRSDMISTSDSLGSGRTARPARNIAVERFPVVNKSGETNTIYAREPLNHSDIISPRSYYDVTYPLMSRLEFTRTLTLESESDYLPNSPSPKIAYDIAMQSIIEEGRNALNAQAQELMPFQAPLTLKTSREWTLLIGGYSNRLLTCETDKLPAISALARRFSLTDELRTPRTYLAGLWLEDLPWLLCWRVSQRRFEKRPEAYCAPTWSWASVGTPVIWDKDIFDAKSRIEVLNASTAPVVQTNIFGRVKGAYVILRGLVQRAVLEVDVQHNAVLALRNARGERIFFVPDLNFPIDHQDEDASSKPPNQESVQLKPNVIQQEASLRLETYPILRSGVEVSCLWLLQSGTDDRSYALALANASSGAVTRSLPLADSTIAERLSNNAAVFERVGLITAMSRVYQKNDIPSPCWFVGAKMDTVCIV